MKLYFTPGTCSLSPHIVANEAGVPLELVKVDLAKKTTSDGQNFLDITAKGYVPALQLDDKRILTEGVAIVQYLADLKPEKNLLPPAGTYERAKVQEWLNYIATELQKSFGPLFRKDSTEAEKKAASAAIGKRLTFVEAQLEKTEYLTSSQFCVADAYLFTIVGWCDHVSIDISKFLALKMFMDKIAARQTVKDAITAEKAAK